MGPAASTGATGYGTWILPHITDKSIYDWSSTNLASPNFLQDSIDTSTTEVAQGVKLVRSAGEVLGQIGKVGKLHKARVEQAGFAVLKAPDIPSILVETAFISNPEEEEKLRDRDYQRQLVQALATGIKRYFARNPPLARGAPSL